MVACQRLINYEYDATTGGDIPKLKLMLMKVVIKELKLLSISTKDEFSTSQDKKVLITRSIISVCSHGYNQYGEYKEDQPWQSIGLLLIIPLY